MSGAEQVCLGVITAPHGVRGLVKLRSYCAQPADIVAYGPLRDEAGRRTFTVALQSEAKGQFIARIDGVADRDAAEALRNVRLYVDRAALPAAEDEDEFYHADLVGLEARLGDGTVLGRVGAVFDHGAGDVIEIGRQGQRPLLLPFTRAAVPTVDVAGGYVIVDPPGEIEVRPDALDSEGGSQA